MKSPLRIGVVGLGNIGQPMAERLAGAGVSLSVFDMRSEQTHGAVAKGAFAAASLEELANRSDIVLLVVRKTQQVVDTIAGPGGLLEHLKPGSLIAVHSTMNRHALLKLAEACAPSGISLLDAPVSGGETGAADGTLTFMIGGEPLDLERARPVLEILAGKIFHLGGIGAGQAGKLINNLLATIGIVGATEAMRLAKAAEISEDMAAELMRASSGNNNTIQHWEYWRDHIREDGAQLRITEVLRKDVKLALEMAGELGLNLPLGALAGDRIAWSVDLEEINENPN